MCQILAQLATFLLVLIFFHGLVLTPAGLAQGPAERRELCWGSLNCPTFGVAYLFSLLPGGPAQRPSISQAGPPQPRLGREGRGESIAPSR